MTGWHAERGEERQRGSTGPLKSETPKTGDKFRCDVLTKARDPANFQWLGLRWCRKVSKDVLSGHHERVRMYVCPKCNSLVDQPKRRWWSGWRYCPNDHVLYVRGLGPSLEQSFWKSFLKGLARGIGIFGLIVVTLAIAPDVPSRLRGSVAPSMGFVVAIFYLFVGLRLFGKAHFWAGRAGPVQRLVPHARGRAYGFLAAIACQLGITIALLFAK